MRAFFILLLCGIANATPGFAESFRAVLIGVSDYDPALQSVAPKLEGPGHDVALIHEILRQKGVPEAAITVLSDRPDLLDRSTVDAPTRGNILNALENEVSNARQGAEILIYFSGHGAQIPRKGGADQTELDGLDEVLLPSDFKRAVAGGASEFVNHITDDEIGHLLDGMIEAGATVWLVADACHSGTLRRSAGAEAVARYADLGFGATPVATKIAPIARAETGGFIGFYGAKAGELAYELPVGDKVHGLLTLSLAKALRAGEAMQFSDLAQHISRDLWRYGQGRASPAFSGNLGARQFFATKAHDPWVSLRWASDVSALVLDAGRLEGLTQGASVSVFGGSEVPLFSANIAHVGLTLATLELPENTEQLDEAMLQEGLDPDRFRHRWLADRAPNLRARIEMRPINSEMAVELPNASDFPQKLRSALRQQIEQEPALRVARDQVSPVSLRFANRRILIEPADPGAVMALSVAAELPAVPELVGHLRRIAKSRALLDVAESLHSSDSNVGLHAELNLRAGERLLDGSCQATSAKNLGGVVPEVGDCDEILVTLINNGAQDIDITPLYIASDFQIYFLTGYEGSTEGGMRLNPGGRATLRYTEVTESAGVALATGGMHLMFLAVVSDGTWPPRDFRYLQEIAPPPLTRTAVADPLAQLLQSAAFGLRLRSTVTPRDSGSAGAVVIPLRTVRDEDVVQAHDR